jgi:hypothetical protein
MNACDPQDVEDQIDSHVLVLLKEVVRKSHEQGRSNPISRALLYFLLRVCNTWQTILNQEYDRVKHRYLEGKKGRVRSTWYAGNLSQIARMLDKETEYDSILAVFHGCVHSSAFAVKLGPPVSPEYVSHWASTIAARVARLSVAHNKIALNDLDSTILARLSAPYSWLSNS